MSRNALMMLEEEESSNGVILKMLETAEGYGRHAENRIKMSMDMVRKKKHNTIKYHKLTLFFLIEPNFIHRLSTLLF